MAEHDDAGAPDGFWPVARELEGVEGARLEPEPAEAREEQLADERRVPRGADAGQQHVVEPAQPKRRRLDRIGLPAGDQPQRAGLGIDRVVHVVRMAGARRRRAVAHVVGLRYFAEGKTGARFSRIAFTPSRTSGYENESISSARD